MSKLNRARADWVPRVIVSGGGTGGHIFPAVAIADEIKLRYPDAEILFVGAQGRMEMEKVPKAGYQIEGLPIAGLQRKKWWKNFSWPFKVWRSLQQSKAILKRFQPDLAIGTGGYAGGPLLYAAAGKKVPTLILEPNAFAGLANKWLGSRVDKICIAFNGMERYFPPHKLIMTGNPVREQMLQNVVKNKKAIVDQGGTPLSIAKPGVGALGLKQGQGERSRRDKSGGHILLIGGSQGARSLNRALRASAETIAAQPNIHWTWQCGALYIDEYQHCETAKLPNVTITAFIDRMDEAYSRADLIIGRAGAMTIAELTYLGKPSLLVPSPNVAEDHQTVNAKALEKEGATVHMPDRIINDDLAKTAIELINNPNRLNEIGQAAAKMGSPGAVGRIVDEALALIPSPKKVVEV
ncbi:MAG: undecaprenyldiphospho-muramoylpentapeptide beta-N-acetylglucosaminyltransferase [Bacteroidota bacterium]